MNSFWSLMFSCALFTILIACLHAGSMASQEFKTKPILQLQDDLRREFSKPNRWGYSVVFFPCMSRLGYTHSLRALIDLRGMRLKSVPEIEKLHAIIYGEALSKINSIRSIRPFLANFPLSRDSFSLSIGFHAENGMMLSPPYVVSIIMGCGSLEFNQFIKDKLPDPFETILTKPIAESEELHEFYNCKVERKSCVEKPIVPKVSYILSCCDPFQHAVFEFSQSISAKYGLNFVDLTPTVSQFKDKTPFNLILWKTAQLTKDAARKLAAECSREFLKFVQNDKRTLEFMVERSKNEHVHDDATFPDVRHIGFHISFWDDNIDRQIEPFIAEIRMFEGKLTYFTADDGQRLVLVHEESFEDAQAFLNSIAGG